MLFNQFIYVSPSIGGIKLSTIAGYSKGNSELLVPTLQHYNCHLHYKQNKLEKYLWWINV